MADIADIAQERIEQTLETKLANRVRFVGVSLTHCESCGEEIPQARRDALPGVRLCVDCKTISDSTDDRRVL